MKHKNEIYRDAADLYGFELQLELLIEECAELIKEIQHFKRFGNNITSIIDEMADVWIMLEQNTFIFDASSIIEKIKKEKLERLEKRINNDRQK